MLHRLFVGAAAVALATVANPSPLAAGDNMTVGSILAHPAIAHPGAGQTLATVSSTMIVAGSPGIETTCPQVLTNPAVFDASSVQICTALQQLIRDAE